MQGKPSAMEELLLKLAEKIEQMEGRWKATGGAKRTGCFRCGKEGHFRRDCPEKPKPAENAQPSSQ